MIGAGLIKLRGDAVLARSDLPLLSLRDAANSEPDQPLPAFFAPIWLHKSRRVEPFCRTDRSVVFVRAANRPSHCRRPARYFSDLSHHQRKSFVLELPDDHSISGLLPDDTFFAGFYRKPWWHAPSRRGPIAIVLDSQRNSRSPRRVNWRSSIPPVINLVGGTVN